MILDMNAGAFDQSPLQWTQRNWTYSTVEGQVPIPSENPAYWYYYKMGGWQVILGLLIPLHRLYRGLTGLICL